MKKIITIFICLIWTLSFEAWGKSYSYAFVENGTTNNASAIYSVPLSNAFNGDRHQFFISAAELASAGIAAGSSIGSLDFNVMSNNYARIPDNFVVKIYTTALNNPAETNNLNTSLVAMCSPDDKYLKTSGWINTSFSPFVWNGSDNLVVETYAGNSPADASASLSAEDFAAKVFFPKWYYSKIYNPHTGSLIYNVASDARPDIRVGYESEALMGFQIDNQPQSGAACAGSTFNMTVSTSGAALYYFWWQYYNGSSWGNCGNNTPSGFSYDKATDSGTNSDATMTIHTPGGTSGSYQYRCFIKNGVGNTLTSNAATLTVQTPPTDPTGMSGSTTICNGNSTTLVATGGSNGSGAKYEWFEGGCGNGTVLSSTSSMTDNPTSNTSYYVRRVGNTACTNVTNCFGQAVAVEQPPTPATSISGNLNICNGSSTDLTMSGGSNGTSAYYEWHAGGCSSGISLGSNATITVSPTTTTTYYFSRVGASSTCTDRTACISATVNVDQYPTAPTGMSGADVCYNSAATLIATGGTAGTGCTYQWGTGINAGIGTITGATASSYTTAALTSNASYWVRRVGNTTCTNTTNGATDTVIVRTPPTAPTSITGQDLCYGGSTTLTANGGTEGSGAIYQWYADGCGTGSSLGAASTLVVNPLNATNYYVRRVGSTSCTNVTACTSPGFNVQNRPTILVTITGTTSVCINAALPLVTFTNPQAFPITVTYTINGGSNQTVNVGASTYSTVGCPTGTVGSYVYALVSAVYQTAPVCTHTVSGSATVTVTPTVGSQGPVLPANPTICQGSALTQYTVTAASSATSYTWSVTGTGNTIAGTGTTGSVTWAQAFSGTATVSVIANGCNGPSAATSTTVTVSPNSVINAMTAATCSGTAFSKTPVNVTDGIVVANTYYTWGVPSVTGSMTGGTSGINASSISGTLNNPTNTAQTATYTVTPSTGSCTGQTFTLTVTVNPKPTLPAQTVTTCSGITFNLTPANNPPGTIVPSGINYSWSAPVVTGGMTGGAAGGETKVFGTLTNPTSSPQTATYTVTPTAGGCTGSSFTVTVTVNPVPAANPWSITSCTGASFSITPQDGSNGIIPSGTTYSWNAPAITGSLTGGAASGGNKINVFGTLTNPAPTTGTAVYTVTPLANSCPGAPFTVTVSVAPVPTVNSAASGTVCSGVALGYMISSPSPSTYTWSRAAVPGISNTAVSNQNANPIGEALNNTTSLPVNVIYLITPSINGCMGTQFTYTVTVNPKPVISAMTYTACTGVQFTVTPADGTNGSVPTGTKYTWPAPSLDGGLTGGAAGTNQANITNTLTNGSGTNKHGVYTVTPTSGAGCAGAAFTLNVTVTPNSSVPAVPVAPTTTWLGDHYVKTGFKTAAPSTANTAYYKLCGSADNGSTCNTYVNSGATYVDGDSVTVAGTDLPSNGAYRNYFWWGYDICGNHTSSAGTYIRMDNDAPTQDTVIVSSNCWTTDGTNAYTITVKSTKTGIGWGGQYGIMALVNWQGENAGQYGGYFGWNPVYYVFGAEGENVAATGGGYASKYNGTSYPQYNYFGKDKVTLLSCSTTLNGNQRTVVFTVRPNTSFPLLADNDVSVYVSDSLNNFATDWRNFQTNFASSPAGIWSGAVTGGTSVCSGSTSNVLTLSGYTGTITKWQSSVSPFSTWTDISNTANTYTSAALTQTTEYRAVVRLGSCGDAYSNYTTVTVQTAPTAPTSITGTTAICSGASTTLTADGGSDGSGATLNWTTGVCQTAFVQEFNTQPYTTFQTTVNSVNGILNVTSTSSDPNLMMSSLGSFDPNIYKYIKIRYRVVSGSSGNVEIFYLNSRSTVPVGDQMVNGSIIADGAWHTLSIDMSVGDYWSNSNITGWRYDWINATGVTMDIDYIALVSSVTVGTGSSITVSPASNTTYYVQRAGNTGCTNVTSCASAAVTVSPLSNAGTVTQTPAASGDSVCSGTVVTYQANGTTGTFNYFQYQWNSTSPAGWSGSWGTTNPYNWGANVYGAGKLYVRAVVTSGTCAAAYSAPVSVQVLSNTNSAGAVHVSPSAIAVGGTATITNDTLATAGSPPSFGPKYRYYWMRTSAPATGWRPIIETSASSYAVPHDVTDTAGTYMLARNAVFDCGGEINDANTINIPLTVSVPFAIAPITGTTTVCPGAQTTLSTTFPSGGTISVVNNYRIHTFTTSAGFNVPIPNSYEVLVVAGGGGGSYGGGGAGGVVYNAALTLSGYNTIYPVTVGNGGSGGSAYDGTGKTNGGNSSISTLLVAVGGGAGGDGQAGGTGAGRNGNNGGSGGGGSGNSQVATSGGTGTTGQGNNGGGNASKTGSPYPGGGGGGAGAAGNAPPSNSVSGNGGNGVSYGISGTMTTYGGGGGCGFYGPSGTPGNGGAGGGGNGGSTPGVGVPNTGGGGGGGKYSPVVNGASGGSGVVIVRYPDITAGTWSSDNPSVATVNATTGVVTGVAAGTANITYSYTYNGGVVSSASTQVTVNPAPALGSLSNSGPIEFCSTSGCFDAVPITVTGAAGTINWDYGSSDGTWHVWGLQGTSPGYCAFPSKVAASDGNADRIRYSVNNSCGTTAYSSTILIKNHYNAAPDSLKASVSPVCSGSSVTLTAYFTNNIDILGTVEFFATNCSGTPIASVTAGNNVKSVSTNVSPAATTTYYARYNPGTGTGCSPTSCVSRTVTVSAPPTTANAGIDITPACGATTATLAGNTPSSGSGTWTVVSGTATVTTPSSPTSGVTGLAVPGTATLRWTIANSPCAPSTDDVVITTTTCNITCGAQEWMSVNVNNGTRVNGSAEQNQNSVVEKYCYNDVDANCVTYGGLYQWAEAMQLNYSYNTAGYTTTYTCDPCLASGVQGVCPSGYHVPTDLEFSRYEWCVETNFDPVGTTSLSKFQTIAGNRGSATVNVGAGDKMRASNVNVPSWTGTNTSGFTALPGGYRLSTGVFGGIGGEETYWTATESATSEAMRRDLNGPSNARQSYAKTRGWYVRCMKNTAATCPSVTAPVASAASGLTCSGTSFTANWAASSGATNYFIDVATNSGFSSYVTGYQDSIVGNVTTLNVTGLTAGTTYYYRVRANRGCASSSSNVITVTLPVPPTTANAGADIFPACGATTATLAGNTPTIGYGTWTVISGAAGITTPSSPTSGVTLLAVNGVATLRWTITNDPCTASTDDVVIYTYACGPTCGTQEWAAANVNNGTKVSTSADQTNDAVVEKWCYNNIESNCTKYGALYQWAEALQIAYANNTSVYNGPNYTCDPCGSSGVQGICPSGYHIPTDLEWSRYEWCVETTIAPVGKTPLATFQTVDGNYRGSTNGNEGTGTKIKATSSNNPSYNGTNASGFNALPSGYKSDGGNSIVSVDEEGSIWTVTQSGQFGTFKRTLHTNDGRVERYSGRPKTEGRVVRCLRNAAASCTPPVAPVANAATNLACTSFTANWAVTTGATNYFLDVATDAGFTAFVTGYNNLIVGNVTTLNVTGLTTGTTYYYHVRATNGCASTSSNTITAVTTTVPAQPSTITGTTPVCVSASGVTYSVTNVSGVTYAWTYTGNGFTCVSCAYNAITANFSGSATSGTLTCTPSNTCGNGTARTLAITVNPFAGTPTTPTPSATTICQGSTPTAFTTSATNAISYNWTVTGTGNSIAGTGTTGTVTWGSSFSGTATVSVTATGCGTSPAASTTVTVCPTPTATISGTTSVCQNAMAPNITFTNPQALPITVTYNINGSNQTTVNVGASTTATVAAPTGTAGTFNYNLVSVVYQNTPTCSNTITGTATITVQPVLSTSAPSGATALCQGASPAAYTTSASGATSYAWSVTGAGNSIAGTGTTGTVTWGSGFSGTATVSVIASGPAACNSPAATTIVTVSATPTTANAGTDITPACGATTATLAGNTPAAGTGLWSVVSGTATITTPTSPTSGVTGLAASGGTATLRWTISNGTCTPSTDDVVITTTACFSGSGIINTYQKVTALDVCHNSVTVGSASGFAVGNKILLIQMKGAVIDISNTTSSGSITDYANAGNYEFAIISNIVSNEIYLRDSITKSYDVSGSVQIVSVPGYTSITVSDTLKCAPWDGNVGGILVFDASGTVTLNAPIYVSGNGFKGGRLFTCSAQFLGVIPTYYVQSATDSVKGEGISITQPANNIGGRGTIANGGGAAGAQNMSTGYTDAWYNGGGGGGNFGTGGDGGLSSTINTTQYPGGVGGRSLNYSNVISRIYPGGGGGSGHRRYTTGGPTNGTNGGGIVIINANTIVGNSNSILADGIDNQFILNNVGRGGGGAGGTVVLNVQNYSGSINVSAKGGKGGDNSGGNSVGPGGGGGGGVVRVNQATVPANITATVSGGLNGQWIYTTSLAWGRNTGSKRQHSYRSCFTTKFQSSVCC